jgi:glyoxylase-like metal-dependent hydrolase (beta-lactamase superfamily II)
MKVADGLYAFVWTSITENNCNSYLIDGPAKILIDPGHFRLFDYLESRLKAVRIEVPDIDLVLVTHAHPDHLEAVRRFQNHRTLFALSAEDWRLIEPTGDQLKGYNAGARPPDFFLGPGDLNINGIRLKIIPAPGHSPGSVAIYWPDRKALFTGDVIFRDGLGRTDLPGGNGSVLKRSIKELSSIDCELLLPGHMEIIKGSAEIKENFRRVEELWFRYI